MNFNLNFKYNINNQILILSNCSDKLKKFLFDSDVFCDT